jgi:hypothetical protein
MRRPLWACVSASVLLLANGLLAHQARAATFFSCPQDCTSGYSCPGGCQCYGYIFNPSKHYCAATL